MLFVPLRTSDLHYSRWQSGESARCCPLGPSRCFATCSWCQGRLTLFLCHFRAIVSLLCLRSLRRSALFSHSSAPACPRGCLLDVSCFFGLTLRPSARVCCCHQDSLARSRPALAQEAARDASSSSSHLSF